MVRSDNACPGIQENPVKSVTCLVSLSSVAHLEVVKQAPGIMPAHFRQGGAGEGEPD